MKQRHRNDHLRKLCGCPRRAWAKCDHPWHFNFRLAGKPYRFSLDRELGRRIRSKMEAETARDEFCAAIRNGKFCKRGATTSDGGAVLPVLTLQQLIDAYDRGHVQIERPETAKRWRTQVKAICRHSLTLPNGALRPFGDWAVTDVTTDAILQFQELRRPVGVFAMNRDLGVLRAVFNWALGKGLFERTPFKRGDVSLIRRAKETRRSRRLEPGEYERLLAACGAHLRALVEAAIETGCRRGELLTLQWSQVRSDGPRPALILTAAKTKTRTLREIPISARLKAILDMRRTGPDGQPHKASAHVFGDETGGAVNSFKRAWTTAKLRAHGVTPEYIEGSSRLTPACLERLAEIDLHFHDLRREAGSRWLDAGVPLHTIQRWLGHTNIAQTSTYLAVTDTGSHDAMARFDAARSAATPTAAPDAAQNGRSADGAATGQSSSLSESTERTH